MLNFVIKINLLKYLDEKLWGTKCDDFGSYYEGLVLDFLFENSVYCYDYLNIEDMIQDRCFIEFSERTLLEEQYKNISDEQFIKLAEVITNIMLKTTHSYLDTELIGKKMLNFIGRIENVNIIALDEKVYEFQWKYKINEGSYNYIIEVDKNTLKKIMKEEYLKENKFIKRFKEEFEIMQKLSESPYILKVFGFDETEHSYLMEKCECDLYDYLEKNISFEETEIFHIFDDVLSGMQYAHNNHIIHRDLHLGNILRINNDYVICDFGLAKDLSRNNSLKSSSTPKNGHYFMDPVGKVDFTKLDITSDIYSIAKIFEYVIEKTTSAINLDYVISKSTSRKKEDRYQNIDEFIKDYRIIRQEYFKEIDEKNFIYRIVYNNLNASDVKEIMKLANDNNLSKFILNNNIKNFSKIILNLPIDEQGIVLNSINNSYISATEFGHFEQYDVFSQLAYDVILNSSNPNIITISTEILEGCAGYRYSAKNKLIDLKNKQII